MTNLELWNYLHEPDAKCPWCNKPMQRTSDGSRSVICYDCDIHLLKFMFFEYNATFCFTIHIDKIEYYVYLDCIKERIEIISDYSDYKEFLINASIPFPASKQHLINKIKLYLTLM